MIPTEFRAYFVDEQYQNSIRVLPVSAFPDTEVYIQVEYSSLNYKDALSSRGLNKVTKTYPHVPGIDAVGKVIDDQSGTYNSGESVIVTGNDLGTNTFGGFGEIIRVPKQWVVKIPELMTPIHSMVMGTAGFTALYGIHRLQVEGIQPESGPILVTGATGGVGSFAVFALAQLGYDVVAASRKSEAKDFLFKLGANTIVSSDSIKQNNERPLHPRIWAGCIETVGGELLDAVLTQTYPKGAVACCGNVLGINLNTNVLPFILRGISLLGIDSAFCERSIRESIWNLATKLDFLALPNNYYKVVTIDQLNPEIEKILNGDQKGRVVISHK